MELITVIFSWLFKMADKAPAPPQPPTTNPAPMPATNLKKAPMPATNLKKASMPATNIKKAPMPATNLLKKAPMPAINLLKKAPMLATTNIKKAPVSPKKTESWFQLQHQDTKKVNPTVCMFFWCGLQLTACTIDKECMATIQCMQGCEDGRPDVAQCQFECEMTIGQDNVAFQHLLECMSEHECFATSPPDGSCLATADQTAQELTEIDMVAGDWWVVRGLNCGQEGWPGAYDWYPCQHARYVVVEDGWVNNTTYCGGKDSVCTTDIIVTMPHATMPSPGLIQLEYDDAPLLPQVERWHLMSKPGENFMFVIWCGTNPALEYNGAFVLSRTRTAEGMSAEEEAAFRAVASAQGIDYDAMCLSDNTACPE